MRSPCDIPVHLILLLTVAFQVTVEAKPLLTVTCDDPQGAEISYGSGLLGLQENKVETASVVYPGLHPIFLLDDDKPKRLLVIFSEQTSSHEPTPEPEKTFEAAIIYATDDQITAVYPRAETVWMYSLFPKLGMGYFTSHNHIPFGYTSRSVSTYAMCHFARSEP